MTFLGDGNRFNHGNIGQLQLVVAHLFNGVGQVLVDEHDLALVDRLAQGGIHLKGHPAGQNPGFGHLLVQIVAEAGAGQQADFQRLLFGPFDQSQRDSLGFPCTGKAAHANGHAIFNQQCCFCRAHDLVMQRRHANTIFIHGIDTRRMNRNTFSL